MSDHLACQAHRISSFLHRAWAPEKAKDGSRVPVAAPFWRQL